MSSEHLRRLRFWLLAAFFALPAFGGLLTFIQVFRDGLGADGLAGAVDVALSPGGEQVYAVGRDDHALAVFKRNATNGTLTFVEFHEDGEMGVFGLLGASSAAASPDGRHVYVTAETDDTLAVFSRDATTDELTFVAAAVQENLVGGVFGLDGASDVTVSPDDEQVFVAARVDDAVAVFSRDATTDDLTFVEAEYNNFAGVSGLDGAQAVAVSPDGKHLYVASSIDDAVAVFERNQIDGTISFVGTVADGAGGVDGLDGASGIAVSPDGFHVYVAGEVDDAVTAFDRDPISGQLTFVGMYRDGVGGIEGLDGATAVTLNPAGDRVLVAGRNDNAVAVFRRSSASGDLDFLEALRDGFAGVDGLAGVLAIAASDDGEHAYAAGHDEDAVAGFDIALCLGDEATGDTDGDAFCDDIDICLGDDLDGDSDGDTICGDLDVCPGFDDTVDSDGDDIPDGCDVCLGDDATGDADMDSVCDDTDICPGFSDLVDTDGDGVPEGCDLCLGDDATGDSDSDGVCDDIDICSGFDDGLDSDGDGIPDGCDPCPTNDATFTNQTVTGPMTVGAHQTVTLGPSLTLDGTAGPVVVQASQSIAVFSGTSFSGQVSLEIVASPCN